MEKTSDVNLTLGVRSATTGGNGTPPVVTPGAPQGGGANGANMNGPAGADGSSANTAVVQTTQAATSNDGLAATGQSAYLVGGVVATVMVAVIIGVIYLRKRQQWGIRTRRKWPTALGLVGCLMSALSVWGLSVSATPVMSLQSSLQSANLRLVAGGATSQPVQNTLQLTAHSSTGYLLEARLVDSNLPAQGVEVTVSGGEAAQPAVLKATDGLRLVTHQQPDNQRSITVTVQATATAAAAEGDYQAKVRFSLKPLPNPSQVAEFASIADLMAAPLQPGDFAKTIDHTESNDQVRVLYKIESSLPTNSLMSRVAAPLANGNYAVPQILNTKLPEVNSSQRTKELLEVAQTYADAGNKLVWDPTRSAPLHTGGVVHQRYSAPYALTCSSFVGMALLAWKYENTTYVANTNTASYPWGTTFERPAGTQPPFQAWKLLAWYYWQNRAVPYLPGTEEYQPGDLLFFSQQNPEGVGTRPSL